MEQWSSWQRKYKLMRAFYIIFCISVMCAFCTILSKKFLKSFSVSERNLNSPEAKTILPSCKSLMDPFQASAIFHGDD